MSDPNPEPALPRLGSLAQSARSKQLNTARGILIAIGILTVLVNGIQLAMARDLVKKEMDKAIQAQMGPGQRVDPAERERIENTQIFFVQLVCGGLIFLGVLFVIFGLIIKLFPVPVTVTSLVLYVGITVVFAVLDPASLGAGLIIKILIVVALVKAIQSAIAYQKAQRSEALQVSLAEE
jgi:hypothetical protein